MLILLDLVPHQAGAAVNLPHGAGSYADPDSKSDRWGGRKAQAYVDLTIATAFWQRFSARG